jgi:hypothetical protein
MNIDQKMKKYPEILPDRVNKLRNRLISAIPCGEVETAHLCSLPFSEIVYHYMIFATRHIPSRPRSVYYLSDFWSERALNFAGEIFAIENAVAEGRDLSPHLHDAAFECGYAIKGSQDKWNKSKDFALNAYMAHHLHISSKIRANGRTKRSKELLFIRFWNNNAVFMLLGDHKSFDNGEIGDKAARLNLEVGFTLNGMTISGTQRPRNELTKLARYGISTFTSISDIVVPDANIMTDGTSFFIRRHSDLFVAATFEVNEKLEDRSVYEKWYENHPHLLPEEPDFQFFNDYTSLVVIEQKNKIRINILEGLL